MVFMIDLLSNIWKSVERNGVVGDEKKALRVGLQTVLGKFLGLGFG